MADGIDPRLADSLVEPTESVAVSETVISPVSSVATTGLAVEQKIDRLATAFANIQTTGLVNSQHSNLFKTLASAVFWNDALTRALNTALQVSLAAVGTGAVGLTEIDYMGILNLAGGGAVISFMTSLVRATTPKS